MIYFAYDQATDTVKIGTSGNVPKRLKELRRTFKLERVPVLLGADFGGLGYERVMHRRFAHLRVTREWFTADDELMAFARSLPERLPIPAGFGREFPPRPEGYVDF